MELNLISLQEQEYNRVKDTKEWNEWWKENGPYDIYWDYRDELSEKMIEILLDKDMELWDRKDAIHDYIFENWLLGCEWEWYYEKGILERTIEYFDLESFEHHEVDLYGRMQDDDFYPMYINNYDVKTLIRNTRGMYFTVSLGIEHIYDYRLYYDGVEEELAALGINPVDMLEWFNKAEDDEREWPDIQDRNPLITPEDLAEAWVNWGYGGTWTAMLDASDILMAAWEGNLEKMTVLKKGAPITIYCYMNGGGSTIHHTLRDTTVDPSTIHNDGADRYGIQSCYGLIYEAWSGELEEPGE